MQCLIEKKKMYKKLDKRHNIVYTKYIRRELIKMTTTIYDGLEYTTREINSTFKIKVNGLFNGKKINTLVGVYGLLKLVGVEMANKLLRRAFRCLKDAEHCKLRRGLKISFYYY